jgi:hypothetical protein
MRKTDIDRIETWRSVPRQYQNRRRIKGHDCKDASVRVDIKYTASRRSPVEFLCRDKQSLDEEIDNWRKL